MTEGVKQYEIERPAIPTGNLYHFTTDKGVRYEVRFGRKQENFLNATIVFGVLNEEYEGEEYVVTNKGDIYSVMATVVQIVKLYRQHHPNIVSYEFCGEPNKNQPEFQPTVRTKLYIRYLTEIFSSEWTIVVLGNKVIVSRKR